MRADVAIGAHGWTVRDTDPEPTAPLAASIVGDGMQLVRALPTDRPWPVTPQPARVQLTLYAASSLDLADIVLGTPVSVRWRSPRDAATPLEVFDGLVSDVQLSPHWLGVQASVVAVDYRAQLAELQVTPSGVGSSEIITDRADRWMSEVGLPPLTWVPVAGEPDPRTTIAYFPPDVQSPNVDASVDKVSLGDSLDQLFSWWITVGYAVGAGHAYAAMNRGVARYVAVPLFSAYDGNGLRTLTGWGFTPMFRDARIGVLPGLFADTGGGVYGIVMDPHTDPAGLDPIVSAGVVDFDASYYQSKGVAVPNTIVASWVTEVVPDTEYAVIKRVFSNGDVPAVVAEVESLPASDITALIGGFYLPEQGTTALSWSAEEFRWALYADAPGRYVPALGQQLTIIDTLSPSNPRGLSYFSGLLSGYTLTVTRARPVVTFNLRSATGRLLSDAADPGIQWGDIPAGVTWAQLRARETWDDYKLVRRTP